MSKYHPLDVRHPANRDLLSRNFLLDPPAQDRVATGSRARRAAAAQVQTTPLPPHERDEAAPQARPAQPMAPWGQHGQATAAPTPALAARRRGSWRLWIILIGLGAYALTRPDNQGIVADALHTVIDFFDDLLF